jgi:tetratricopeptide (TPR) repeat protein
LSDYKQMESIFAQLAASHQEEPEYKRYLALSRYGMASILTDPSQQSEADNLRRAALVLQEKLVAEYPRVPEYRKELAATHQALAYTNHLGDMRCAPDWEKELRCALGHYEKLVADFPIVTDYFIERENAKISLGIALLQAGRSPEAEPILRRSLAALQGLPPQTRGPVRLRLMEVNPHIALGGIYAQQGRNDEAVKEHRASIDIEGALAREFPSVPQRRQGLAWMHRNLGHQYLRMLLWKQAEQEFRLARELLEHLAAEHSADADYASDVGNRDFELAFVCINQGRSADALQWCTSAEQRFREVRRQKPKNKYLRGADELLPVYRARDLAQQGRYEVALAEAERCGVKPRFKFDLACAYALLSAVALQNDKLAPPERSRISEAHASRAIELLAGIDWKGWDNEPYLLLLKTNKDLGPLRARPDFIAQVKRAEEDSAKQAGK